MSASPGVVLGSTGLARGSPLGGGSFRAGTRLLVAHVRTSLACLVPLSRPTRLSVLRCKFAWPGSKLIDGNSHAGSAKKGLAAQIGDVETKYRVSTRPGGSRPKWRRMARPANLVQVDLSLSRNDYGARTKDFTSTRIPDPRIQIIHPCVSTERSRHCL